MLNGKPENALIRFQNEIIVDLTLSASSVIKRTFGSFSSSNNKAFVTCQSDHVEYRRRNSQQFPIHNHNNEIHYPTNLLGVGLKIITMMVIFSQILLPVMLIYFTRKNSIESKFN